MATCTLLLFSVLIFASASALLFTERAALIDSAIADVQGEFRRSEARAMSARRLPVPERRMRAFKASSASAQAQGKARRQFEEVVKRAERKIVEKNREAMGQDVKKLTQSYAKEFMHTPGSLLTSAEIAQIYRSSGCDEYSYENYVCTDENKFWRSASGACNNLEYPSYGAAGTQMKRLTPAHYEDGISSPRGHYQSQNPSIIEGTPFSPPNPSPRIISLRMIEDIEDDDPENTLMLMQWGQFMDHDLDSMPEYLEEECESCDVSEESEGRCFPFRIPCNDFDIIRLNSNCHGFRRSLPACEEYTEEEYTFKARNHFNDITHYIDGSTLYNHNRTAQETLRRLQGGELRLVPTDIPGTTKRLLPETTIGVDFISCPNLPCFLAGDHRINEQPALISMHTLWAREHNRIAKKINKEECSDEQVFQLARIITANEMNKINYYEYLPVLLGDFHADVGLGKYGGYDVGVDPSIPNCFASAAFRFGHSQIQPLFDRIDENGVPMDPLLLVESFFTISKFKETGTDPILRGLLNQPARSVDEFLNSVITNQLFAADADGVGLDLASLNIQRGRDHGIAPYIIWKNWAKATCHFEESDFALRHSLTEIRMYQVYGSLDTVDLFIGGLAEKPLKNGVVGPTFACIFAMTFLALRDGDRFYFENSLMFNHDQIESIRQTSLSRVICDNTEEMFGPVPINAFKRTNIPDQVQCGELPRVDLDMFDCTNFPNTAAINDVNKDDEILSLLQNVMEKLEAKTAYASKMAAAGKTDAAPGKTPGHGTGGGKKLLSEEELAAKLEEILYKVKK